MQCFYHHGVTPPEVFFDLQKICRDIPNHSQITFVTTPIVTRATMYEVSDLDRKERKHQHNV